jgi:cytochrome P450
MNTAARQKLDLNTLVLSDRSFKANPYAIYERLRVEAPVCPVRFTPGGSSCWLITRYDDVVSILRDHQRVANDRRNAPSKKRPLRLRAIYAIFGSLLDNMLGSDEPDHTRLRSLVHKAFTQKRVEELRSGIESLSDELLGGLRPSKQWDLIHDFALNIPTTVIAQMLGIPLDNRRRFHRMFNSLLLASATSWQGMVRNMPSFFGFLRYLRKLVQDRRRNPQDDLISALVAAEEAGDKLNEDELVSMIMLLLVAGYETTVNLIGNGALALLENPKQFDVIRQTPSLVPSAVEEFLRYYSPLDYTQTRGARTDVTIAGVTIPAGDAIVCAIGSANRDESQFTQPDVLDIAREPNRHIGFGQGIHYCLGAFLARLEGQIAFRALLQHFPELHLAVPREQLRWRQSLLLRGLESLPVSGG